MNHCIDDFKIQFLVLEKKNQHAREKNTNMWNIVNHFDEKINLVGYIRKINKEKHFWTYFENCSPWL